MIRIQHFNSRLTICSDLDVDMKYMYSCMSKGSRTKRGIVYFYWYKFENDRNRFRLFSRKILRASRNSKLEPQNSILDSHKH